MVYALDHLGRQLAALPAHSRDHRGPPLSPPAEGSPAAREQEQLTELQRPRWNDLHTMVHLRLSVAEETLASAGKMIADPEAIYSVYPLLRSSAELSSRVVWLLDPSITGVKRAERMVGDQLDSLGEIRRLKAPGVKDWAVGRIRDVKTRAGAAGLTPAKPPGRTEAVSRAWDSSNQGRSDVGTFTYQLLAASTHGTLYALMRHITPVTGEDGRLQAYGMKGQYAAQMGTDARTDAMSVVMAMVPYNQAAQRWMSWTGHRIDDWISYLAYVAAGFNQHLDPAPDDFMGQDDH